MHVREPELVLRICKYNQNRKKKKKKGIFFFRKAFHIHGNMLVGQNMYMENHFDLE